MHQLKCIMIMFLSCIMLYSCSDGLEENVEMENPTEFSGEGFTLKSLEEINDPLLSNQLSKSKAHVKTIIAQEFQHLLIEHNLDDLSFDTDHIVVVQNDDQSTAYAVHLTIPQENGEETLNLNGAVTLKFAAGKNISNELRIGYQMEYVVSFDKDGNVANSSLVTEGYYSPKPSNIASKAPKYIVCRYTWCGYGGWSGSYGPAPDWVLELYVWGQTEYFADDIMILDKQWYETELSETPFSQYNGAIKNDIITFYDRERLDFSYGGQKTYWSNFNPKVLGHHVHKQAFVDSFQRWFYRSLDPMNTQTTYFYLSQNPTVMSQVFNLFADVHLQADTEDGAYLEVPYGEYSQNPYVRCLNQASEFLLTPAGLSLLQDLGAGTITIAQFEDALPGCD